MRQAIVANARAWLGTPYHHQASLRGVGADCVGFIRGVYREHLGIDVATPADYSRDWGEASGEETLLAAARRHLVEIDPTTATTADVLVFRYRSATIAKHAALISTPASMIHALEGVGVCEVPLSPWWRRHVAAAFAFPSRSSE